MNESICPTCRSFLPITPKRKTKCPNCGEPIYVRKGSLFTLKESIFFDTKIKLSWMGFVGLDNVKNLDELWGYLNQQVIINTKRRDWHQISTIYLQMGVMSYLQKNYQDCIRLYLLSSHFSAKDSVKDARKYGMELTLSELLSVSNSMIATPVSESAQQIKLTEEDLVSLGYLSAYQSIPLPRKLAMLNELFKGDKSSLNALDKSNIIVVPEKDIGLGSSPRKSKSSGCVIFIIVLTASFLKLAVGF